MSSSTACSPRIRLLAASLAVGGLALVACGGDDDDGASTTASIAPTTASATVPAGTAPAAEGSVAGAAFDEADVEFAQGMIPHHEQAIEMAEIAQDPARGATPEVTELAVRIEAEQDPEIQTMEAWLAAWGQPLEMDTSDGHDMSSMPGMMSVEEMDALATLTGSDFDDMWLTMMIEHHEGAIDMAIEVHTEGASADVKTLATQIISTQQAEIDEMSALLEG